MSARVRRVARPLRSLAGVLGGVAVGAAVGGAAAVLGSVCHQYVVGSARWPVGLVLALALTATLAALLRAGLARPPTRLAAGVAWLVVVLQAAGRRREGDVVIPANVRGYLWLLLGFALLVAVLALPRRRSRRSHRPALADPAGTDRAS